jgi:hypothetical protein
MTRYKFLGNFFDKRNSIFKLSVFVVKLSKFSKSDPERPESDPE